MRGYRCLIRQSPETNGWRLLAGARRDLLCDPRARGKMPSSEERLQRRKDKRADENILKRKECDDRNRTAESAIQYVGKKIAWGSASPHAHERGTDQLSDNRLLSVTFTLRSEFSLVVVSQLMSCNGIEPLLPLGSV